LELEAGVLGLGEREKRETPGFGDLFAPHTHPHFFLSFSPRPSREAAAARLSPIPGGMEEIISSLARDAEGARAPRR
jgi:hypothetical protein